jgi:hypothetical protein
LLGVKAATLYAYVSRGMLPSYRQGIKRQRLYKKRQVESLVGLRPSGKAGEQGTLPAPSSRREGSENDSQIPLAESWIPYVS